MVDCTETVFQFIKRYKIYIMVFWSEIAIVSCFWGLDLPNQTVFQFEPPPHSQSGIAYDKMKKYFPEFLFLDTEVILIQAKWDVNQNNTILNPTTNEIFERLNDSLWNKVNPDYNVLLGVQSYYSTSNITDAVVKNISVQEVINMAMQKKYISDHKDVMVVFIESSIDSVSTSDLKDYIDAIKEQLDTLNYYYPNYYLVLTGMMAIFQDSMKTIQADITSTDIILMPIIFLFMIFMIGSWKLVCLPALSLAMTIMISFGVFYPFAIWWLNVNPMAPSIIMFLSMALSIDYSMFLLSRFTQERKEGKSVEDAVRAMLQYSGHVVLLSGVVLIVCYQAIVIFPISGMETIGYAAGMTIFFCILINISLTASAILQCPNFYGTLDTCPVCCVTCCYELSACVKRKTNQQVTPSESLLLNDAISESKDSVMLEITSTESKVLKEIVEQVAIEQIEARKNNCYFKMTSYTTRYPYKCLVPLFIFALMVPVIYVLTDYTPSIDFTMNFPRDVDSVNAYYVLIDSFNPGTMSPMYISVVAKEGNIWNQHYFDALCAIGNKLIDAGYENNTQMISIGFAPDVENKGALKCITKESSIEMYNALINDPSSIIGNYSNSSYYKAFSMWWNSRVNSPQQTVSYIVATPNFNPYTGSALKNCEHYRDAINEVKHNESYAQYVDIYVHNSLYWEVDSLHKTNKTMPVGLAIIIGIVFILIGFVFKSIFLPFRLFLCIVVPIVFVYGVLTGIFQKGWMNWTTWDSLHQTNGIYWILPVITCTVLIGLALDYEIFLFSRVYEYRSKGFTTSASIILAVSTTGPIISAAGFVMCLAFGGLLLERITASNQMGVVFVFGVFVDTFIVRPLIVPAVLSFADKLNWYPTKMPIPTKDQFGQL